MGNAFSGGRNYSPTNLAQTLCLPAAPEVQARVLTQLLLDGPHIRQVWIVALELLHRLEKVLVRSGVLLLGQ